MTALPDMPGHAFARSQVEATPVLPSLPVWVGAPVKSSVMGLAHDAGVGVDVLVLVGVMVGVSVGTGVLVNVGVSVGIGVLVGVSVGMGVLVGVSVGGKAT